MYYDPEVLMLLLVLFSGCMSGIWKWLRHLTVQYRGLSLLISFVCGALSGAAYTYAAALGPTYYEDVDSRMVLAYVAVAFITSTLVFMFLVRREFGVAAHVLAVMEKWVRKKERSAGKVLSVWRGKRVDSMVYVEVKTNRCTYLIAFDTRMSSGGIWKKHKGEGGIHVGEFEIRSGGNIVLSKS
jgi:hypothetical protein